MTEIESLFCDRMYAVLSKYTPNDMTVDNFSSFLYREFLSLFRDVGIENIVSEVESAGRNGIVDINSFYKAIKDISYFTSEKFILNVFQNSISVIKNQIPLTERKQPISNGTVYSHGDSVPSGKWKTISSSELDKNVANFEIDLSAVPKAEDFIERKPKNPSSIANKIDIITEPDRNAFSGVDLSAESSSRARRLVSEYKEEKEEEDFQEDLTKDASYLTSGGYKNVPTVSIDLDY